MEERVIWVAAKVVGANHDKRGGISWQIQFNRRRRIYVQTLCGRAAWARLGRHAGRAPEADAGEHAPRCFDKIRCSHFGQEV